MAIYPSSPVTGCSLLCGFLCLTVLLLWYNSDLSHRPLILWYTILRTEECHWWGWWKWKLSSVWGSTREGEGRVCPSCLQTDWRSGWHSSEKRCHARHLYWAVQSWDLSSSLLNDIISSWVRFLPEKNRKAVVRKAFHVHLNEQTCSSCSFGCFCSGLPPRIIHRLLVNFFFPFCPWLSKSQRKHWVSQISKCKWAPEKPGNDPDSFFLNYFHWSELSPQKSLPWHDCILLTLWHRGCFVKEQNILCQLQEGYCNVCSL